MPHPELRPAATAKCLVVVRHRNHDAKTKGVLRPRDDGIRHDNAASSDKIERASLAGIDGVSVESKLAEDIDDFGVSASDPVSRVELRLRQSGIRFSAEHAGLLATVASGVATGPVLRVSVNALDGPDYPLNPFSVTLELRQLANVERSKSTQYVATWTRTALGVASRSGLNRGIKNVLNDLLDVFIDDYLAANPRSQQE